ncbi:SusF/SusE family outer membrane protein [Chryseobacterium gotjawalense]|uniref:SusF/SusE family outer membrane protein n=1 Tax=Chryseobacterium gotjawalense TaxID=3042315 RepID=A0ABY8RDA8_9FLAO|nr:SusE domain-containing protein [Chryseobacterium sp. wdc7]WHF51694.1 SusF/SusE family outer membrane protein [Chryseobacterium sp. wdc7]
MKNILKLLMVFLLPLLLINACRDDADRDWTSPEPTFKLYDTTLGANTLYPSMENNPFILTWDNATTGSGSYSVVISATSDFKNKVELAKSDTNTLKTTIGALNTAMLQAGLSPYLPQNAYVRIERGTEVSNTVSFSVTAYPTGKPVITSPTAGSALVLDAAKPTVTATTFKWTDYTYGVNVSYKVEIAASGTTAFLLVGNVQNVKELAVSNFDLNELASKLSLPVNVASSVDVRVTAISESAGGVISKTSDVVTFKLTPYKPDFKALYIVGGATAAGWEASNAQLLYQNQNISEIYTYLENNGEFRFLGQQDWNPINYSLNADGIKDDYKYFATWSANLEVSGNENIKFTGNSGMYKITIDQNTKSITVTPSSNPALPTNVYLVGSIQGWNAGAAISMDQVGDGVFEHTIAIPADGEFKFLGQQDWSGLEWGNIHTGGNSGYLGPNGDNNNIKYVGTGGLYKITANIKMGTYKVTPL